MKSRNKFPLYLAISINIIVFLTWYIIASTNNVFACDDFWHGYNVHTLGFWKAQLHYYLHWEGSFIHTFFATLPHIIHTKYTPFFINILTFIIFNIAIATFLFSFNIIKQRSLIIISTLYISIFFYNCTIGGPEIQFWVCANCTYILGISTALLSIAFQKKRKISYQILSIIFIIATIGNKLSFIPFIYTSLILTEYINKSLNTKRFITISITTLLLSSINILAPGNYIRLSENLNNTISSHSFIQTLTERFLQNEIPFFISCIFLLPISCIIINQKKIQLKKNTTISIIILTIATILIDTIVMFICFKDFGPRRANVIIEISLIVCAIVIQIKCIEKIKENYFYSIISCCIFLFTNLSNIKLLDETIIFSNHQHERDTIVENSQDSTIILPKLPNSGLLYNAFCNDATWIENVYFPYHEKKATVILY